MHARLARLVPLLAFLTGAALALAGCTTDREISDQEGNRTNTDGEPDDGAGGMGDGGMGDGDMGNGDLGDGDMGNGDLGDGDMGNGDLGDGQGSGADDGITGTP